MSHLLGAHQVVCGRHLLGTEARGAGEGCRARDAKRSWVRGHMSVHMGRIWEMSRTPRCRLGRSRVPAEPVQEEAQPRAFCVRGCTAASAMRTRLPGSPWSLRSAPASSVHLG